MKLSGITCRSLDRSQKALTLDQEYELACDLEALWYQLSDAERADIETLTEEYKRGSTLR